MTFARSVSVRPEVANELTSRLNLRHVQEKKKYTVRLIIAVCVFVINVGGFITMLISPYLLSPDNPSQHEAICEALKRQGVYSQKTLNRYLSLIKCF